MNSSLLKPSGVMSFCRLALLAILATSCRTAFGLDIVWTNTAGGNWSVASNWKPNQAPGSADSAFITNNGTYTVTISGSVTVAGFTVGGASGTQVLTNTGTLTLNGPGTVNTNGVFATSGTLNGTGDLTANGPLIWSGGVISGSGAINANGGLTLATTFNLQLRGTRTLNNTGQAVWSSGAIYLDPHLVLNNAASGTFDCATDNTINGDATAKVINLGVFRKTAGVNSTTILSGFYNSNSVVLQSGTLVLNNGGTNSGTFSVAAGATLNLNGGVNSFTATSSITGAGSFVASSGTANLAGSVNVTGANTFSGATANISGDYEISSGPLTVSGGTATFNSSGVISPTTFSMSGGTLNGANDFSISGLFTFDSGTIGGSGLVSANGGILFTGINGKQLTGRTLINTAQAVWSSGTIFLNAGSSISNAPTGIWDIAADLTIQASSASFANAGTLRKTGGANSAILNSAFSNSGSVLVQTGTLKLSGSGAHTGSFVVSPGATLEFSGATHNLNAGSSVTGAGNVQIDSTVNVLGDFNLTGTNIINSGILNASNSTGMFLTTLNFPGGTLGGNGPVTVGGPMSWASGTISGSGLVNVTGAMTLSSVSSKFLTGRTLANAGSAVWSGGGFYLSSGGVLSNSPAGTWDCASDNLINGDSSCLLVNAGLFRKIAGIASSPMNLPFANSGSVSVQTGALGLAGGGTNTGIFSIAAGATLNLSGGVNSLAAGSSIEGAGTFAVSAGTANLAGAIDVTGTNSFSGGTANFTGSYSISGGTLNISGGAANFNGAGVITPAVLNLSSGILGGSNNVTVSAPMTWSSGSISGSGLVVASGGLTIGDINSKFLVGRTLANAGSAVWNGGGLYLSSGAVLSNSPAGTFDCAIDGLINGDSSCLVANAGLFRKTAGSGATSIAPPFYCAASGEMDGKSGTLLFNGGGTNNGNFNTSIGGILSMGAGAHYFNAGSSVTGAGTFAVSGATVNLAGSLNVSGTNSFTAGTANFLGSYSISSGTLNISGGTANFNGSGVITPDVLILSSGTLGGTNDVTVNTPMVWSGGTISGLGSVNAGGGLIISNILTKFLSGRTLNNTAQALWSGGGIYTGGGGVISNAVSGTFDISFDGTTGLNGSPPHTFINAGLLRKTNGVSTTTFSENFTNIGAVEVRTGTMSFSASYIQTDGLTLLDGGNLNVSSPFQLQGGALAGGGTTTGTVTNNSVVNPGWSSGRLNVSGNYIQTTNGALNIAVGGTTPGAGFSQLNVAGAATLAGGLNVTLTNGFIPALNSAFLILTNASRTGFFTNFSSPSGAIWQTNYTATALVLTNVGQIQWAPPADITYGAALGASQLNATTTPSLPGTFTYSPPAGTALNSGIGQILTVTFTPSTPGYEPASLQVPLTVLKAPLNITATGRAKTYGQNADITGTEFVASGLVNGDSVTTASLASDGVVTNATVSGSPYAITITNVLGNARLTNYIITYLNGAFTVNPAPLTITANSQGKTYGQTASFGSGSVLFGSNGLQNGETIGSVTLAVSGNGGAATAAVAGSPYTIAPSAAAGGTFTPNNYTISYAPGNLTVGRAQLTVSASPQGKTYGQTMAFGSGSAQFTNSALQNGETIGTVTLAVSGNGGAGTAAVAGSPYMITPSAAIGGTFAPNNYAITYVPGNLTVGPAQLTVTANPQSKTYGQTVNFGSGSVLFGSNGLQNGETIGSVTLGISNNGGAGTAGVAGSPYTITPSAATGGTFAPGNYAITHVSGNLTVGPAQLTITASPQSKTYGQAVSSGAGSALFGTSGLQNGETVGSVTLAVSDNGGEATAAVAGAPYTITPSGATGGTFIASNYAITYAPGNLTVNRAALTVTANSQSKTYGQTVVFGSGSTLFANSALQNGETLETVMLAVSGNGGAAMAAVAGSPYSITPSAAAGGTFTAGNYAITYSPGNLTVSKAALTVTANNRTKTYGQLVTFAGTEFTTGGLLNNDTVISVALDSPGAVANATLAGSPYNILPAAAVGSGVGNYTINFVNGVLTVSAPSLKFVASPPNLILSWTTNASAFVLNQTASLTLPIAWTRVTSGITVNGTNNTFNASSGNEYYALIAP